MGARLWKNKSASQSHHITAIDVVSTLVCKGGFQDEGGVRVHTCTCHMCTCVSVCACLGEYMLASGLSAGKNPWLLAEKYSHKQPYNTHTYHLWPSSCDHNQTPDVESINLVKVNTLYAQAPAHTKPPENLYIIFLRENVCKLCAHAGVQTN